MQNLYPGVHADLFIRNGIKLVGDDVLDARGVRGASALYLVSQKGIDALLHRVHDLHAGMGGWTS